MATVGCGVKVAVDVIGSCATAIATVGVIG